MHYSFDAFCSSKKLIDMQAQSVATEEIKQVLDLGSVHSDEVICYYGASGLPIAFLEIIRAPGREEPSYHFRMGVWDEIAIGDDELLRLEKILYESLENEGF